MDNVPLAVDLRETVWVSDVCFNKCDIYSGVRLFNGLYIRIALLLLLSLVSIRCHSNCWNIVAGDVVYSARRIMLAASFCNFNNLPMFVLDVEPHVMEPQSAEEGYSLGKTVFEYRLERRLIIVG